MVIRLAEPVESQLRDLADRQGHGVDLVVEEAIRLYLESAAITDLDADEVGETQMAMFGELPAPSSWHDQG